MTALPLPDDHARRMEAARAVARWRIGDSSWADTLMDAYRNPDVALEELRQEMDS